MASDHATSPTSPGAALHRLFDLTGKVAIVTGGSRGLGLQVAEALGEFGATTVLVARRPDELAGAVDHLARQGIRADGIASDLAAPDAPGELVRQTIGRHRSIDILINNAGTTWGEPAETHPLEAWNKVIGLNVTGLFLLTQEVARTSFIPKRGGRIVNIASTEGLRGHHPRMPGTIAYNTAKGAVINMTRALAAEWGRYNINVNALAPGYFPSKLTAQTIERHSDYLIDATPLGRLGGENDLKGAALLLASAAGAHITGQVLVVDGGASAI